MSISTFPAVSLWSLVTLSDLQDQESFSVTIVPPGKQGGQRACVLPESDIGAALLGRRLGEVVQWPTPAGMGSFLIQGIESVQT